MCVISDERLEGVFKSVRDFKRTRCESGLTIFESTQYPVEIWEDWLYNKISLIISDIEVQLSSYQYEFVKNKVKQMESVLEKFNEISQQERVDKVLSKILGES